jgi:hypothetical protein
MAQLQPPDPLKDWTLRLRPIGGRRFLSPPVKRFAMLLKCVLRSFGFAAVGYSWPKEGSDHGRPKP